MQQSPENPQVSPNKNNWTVVVIIIVVLLAGLAYFLFLDEKQPPAPVEEVAPVVVAEPEVIVEEVIEEPIIEDIPESFVEDVVDIVEEEPVIEEEPLPLLSESDNWIKEKMTSLTWRKELLKLVIDDDMIRRLVVFTDNFSQGIIAYEHSPLVKPSTKFDGVPLDENSPMQEWVWDENSAKRFNLYVEFLRSFDVESLVNWYFELKPLIDEAYGELGYPEDDFTETMQEAITRVLDMDIPKGEVVLIRPSVMYKYKSDELESLSDTDKLLLRLGKENLLVIKSVLLEFSDKLGRRRGE
ncbi:DUF3014 domain-containing protein [Thalassotalea atypica]|uniref:DUF3014 domain-containing protein n=1 Tax=Thalassotalea atypica TaxID=2054316 RepID=UPI0025746FE6|nr:DUF3014 domain-containing protein [Thalassotalea atypica]